MKSFAVFVFVVVCSHTVFSQWMPTSGPTGAQSAEIFKVGNYLFVNGRYGGVFRSADKGATWQHMNNGLPRSYFAWALDIDNTNVYIATSSGVYYSSDAGDSWISISESGIVGFAIEASGDEIFVGYHNGLLYYSPDHGATWQSKQTSSFQNTIMQIRKVGSTLWIGLDVRGLNYSLDNGVTWINSTPELSVTNINVSDGELYVSGVEIGGLFSVYRSTDDGATWTRILSTGETHSASSGFFKKGNEIFICRDEKFCYSSDNGITWAVHSLPSLFTFYPWSGVAVVDDDVIISYGDGILFSSDKGGSWVSRNTGYRNQFITNVVEIKNVIASLSFTNGVFVSANEGDEWKQIHNPLFGFFPVQIYGSDDAVVLSYAYHVYRSTNSGETWQTILTPDVAGLTEINGAHLAGFEELLVATSYKGVYFSRNMGDSWKFVPRTTFGASDLLKSYVQNDTVVVLTNKEMFLTTDFGATWQKKTAPELPVQNFSINAISIDKSMITMATGLGIYKSPDFGLSWKKIQYFSMEGIQDMEKVGDRFVICAYSGVYVSGKDGIGWYAFNDGLERYVPSTILISDPYAYVGTTGNGVWRIPVAELLTPRELISGGGSGVRVPQLSADCSTITATNALNDVAIRWYKNGTLIPNESGKTVQSTGAGHYAASFENESDIKMSSSVYVGEADKDAVTVYNIITVNGDGKNDTYIVDEQLTGSKLLVISRWGEVVYSNNAYHNEWSPDQLSPGQYYYLIESKCFGKFKGVLTVIK